MSEKEREGWPVWKRNLLVLSGSQLLAVTGISLVLPFIPFFVRELGVEGRAEVEWWSGLIFSAPFLMAAVFSPVWGHLGDKYGYKIMVARAIAALAITNSLYALVRSPAEMFALRLVQGIVTGFIPAALAMTSASTPAAFLPSAMGQLYASASAGRLVGPALGGALASFLPFRKIFLLVGVLTGIGCILVLVFLKEPPRPPQPTRPSARGNWRHVRNDPRLRLALLGMLASMAAIGMQFPVFPLFVEDHFASSADPALLTGLGFSVVAAFTLLTAPFLGRITARVGLKRTLVAALALVAVSLGLHPWARSLGALFAVRALLGVGAAGIQPALHAMVSRETPEGMRGGITGYANSASILGFFVGPLSGGWLANRIGTTGVFLVSSAIAFACAAGAELLTKQRGRNREIVPIPAAEA